MIPKVSRSVWSRATGELPIFGTWLPNLSIDADKRLEDDARDLLPHFFTPLPSAKQGMLKDHHAKPSVPYE